MRGGRPRLGARAASSAWHLTCAKVHAWESPPLCAPAPGWDGAARRHAVTPTGRHWHGQAWESLTSNN